MASGWHIEHLRREHKRDRFSCGVPSLDEYLAKYARQNDEKGLSRTFVAIRPGDLVVQGYTTLRSGALSTATLPEAERKRLPNYPVPVVHMGRLAVDRAVQGQRLGETLLVDALRRAVAASKEVAAYAVEVIAINDKARAFYVKYGFQELLDDRLHLYLAMKVVAALAERE
jgi:ribosomal protein S18 acetylase RimI-like enzyme